MLLAEQLFLLSLDPNANRPYTRASSRLPYSLNGALLAELMLDGKVKEYNKRLEIVSSDVDDPLLRETLSFMKKKGPKKTTYWVPNLKKIHKNIPRKIAEKLDDRGVGTIEKKNVLGIFPSYTFTFVQKEFVENRKKAFRIVLDKYAEQKEL